MVSKINCTAKEYNMKINVNKTKTMVIVKTKYKQKFTVKTRKLKWLGHTLKYDSLTQAGT